MRIVSAMDETPEERTDVIVDGTGYTLAPHADIPEVQHLIERAAATAGAFVELTLAGGRRASVLVGPRSRVLVVTQTMSVDTTTERLAFNEYGEWDLV